MYLFLVPKSWVFQGIPRHTSNAASAIAHVSINKRKKMNYLCTRPLHHPSYINIGFCPARCE